MTNDTRTGRVKVLSLPVASGGRLHLAMGWRRRPAAKARAPLCVGSETDEDDREAGLAEGGGDRGGEGHCTLAVGRTKTTGRLDWRKAASSRGLGTTTGSQPWAQSSELVPTESGCRWRRP